MYDAQWVPTETLKSNPHNTRMHPQKQVTQLANSMRRFEVIVPLVVDEHGTVLAGHGRLLAAKQLGLEKVPIVKVSHLSEAEKRAFALADNKIAASAGWDRKALAIELGELLALPVELDLDISITGFEPAEIDAIAADFIDPEGDPADYAHVPADGSPVSRSGELWQLGDHRLLCGDACAEADVTQLMAGEKAAMAIPDPPYNVRIKETLGRGKIKHREFAHASGEMTAAQFTSFLMQWMRLVIAVSMPGSLSYVFMDWRHLTEILAAGNAIYGELKNLIVWVKSDPGQGSFYRSQHELICVFKNGDAPHQNNVELGKHGRSRSNVWRYPGTSGFRKGRLQDLKAHPTVKPIALVADAIKDCTRRGDIVLDPFMGSGTTILAAERTGRRAFGLEIDSLYVDTAIRHWQDFTKRDAILASTGQTFDELAVIRNPSETRKTTP